MSTFCCAVVLDEAGKSKGYGFVRFTSEEEQQLALNEMQYHTGIGQKPIRVSLAVPKNAKKYVIHLSIHYYIALHTCTSISFNDLEL